MLFPGVPPCFSHGPGGWTRQTRWPGARGWEGREPAVHVATWVLAMMSPTDQGSGSRNVFLPALGVGSSRPGSGEASPPGSLTRIMDGLMWRREREPRVSCLGADPIPGPHGSGSPEPHPPPQGCLRMPSRWGWGFTRHLEGPPSSQQVLCMGPSDVSASSSTELKVSLGRPGDTRG